MQNQTRNPQANNYPAPGPAGVPRLSDNTRHLWGAVSVGALAFVLYAATAARGALWQDSGMFHMRVFLADYLGGLGLALSHPLYILLARGFASLVHFGDYAWRVNLFSALAAAVTIANIFLVVAWLTRRWTPALLAAVTLALAHTFWARAVIAEVLTLYTALLSFELLCLAGYCRKQNPRWLFALFFFNGLALADHNFALLALFCYSILTVYWLANKTIRPYHCLIMALCWIVGALPFEILIVRQLFAGDSILAVIRSALFGNFQDAVLNVKIPYARVPLYILLNFPTPNLLLAIPGVACLWRPSILNPQPLIRAVSRTMLLMLAVFLFFAVRYRVPDQYEFFIPAYVMAAVAIGLGAYQFFARRPKWMTISLLFTILPVFCYAWGPDLLMKRQIAIPGVKRTIPFRNEIYYFLQPWKYNDHSVEQFVQEIQAKIPPGSLIIADTTTFYPLLYYQQVKNRLSQYVVYNPGQKTIDNGVIVLARRVSRNNEGPPQISAQNLDSLLADRNIYLVSPQPGYCPPWLLDHYRLEESFPLVRILAPGLSHPK
jgi:hypothetical protein